MIDLSPEPRHSKACFQPVESGDIFVREWFSHRTVRWAAIRCEPASAVGGVTQWPLRSSAERTVPVSKRWLRLDLPSVALIAGRSAKRS